MKYEYDLFYVEGGAKEMLARLNEFGKEGWEVFHVTQHNKESHLLSPVAGVWVKREVQSHTKKRNEKDY